VRLVVLILKYFRNPDPIVQVGTLWVTIYETKDFQMKYIDVPVNLRISVPDYASEDEIKSLKGMISNHDTPIVTGVDTEVLVSGVKNVLSQYIEGVVDDFGSHCELVPLTYELQEKPSDEPESVIEGALYTPKSNHPKDFARQGKPISSIRFTFEEGEESVLYPSLLLKFVGFEGEWQIDPFELNEEYWPDEVRAYYVGCDLEFNGLDSDPFWFSEPLNKIAKIGAHRNHITRYNPIMNKPIDEIINDIYLSQMSSILGWNEINEMLKVDGYSELNHLSLFKVTLNVVNEDDSSTAIDELEVLVLVDDADEAIMLAKRLIRNQRLIAYDQSLEVIDCRNCVHEEYFIQVRNRSSVLDMFDQYSCDIDGAFVRNVSVSDKNPAVHFSVDDAVIEWSEKEFDDLKIQNDGSVSIGDHLVNFYRLSKVAA